MPNMLHIIHHCTHRTRNKNTYTMYMYHILCTCTDMYLFNRPSPDENKKAFLNIPVQYNLYTLSIYTYYCVYSNTYSMYIKAIHHMCIQLLVYIQNYRPNPPVRRSFSYAKPGLSAPPAAASSLASTRDIVCHASQVGHYSIIYIHRWALFHVMVWLLS